MRYCKYLTKTTRMLSISPFVLCNLSINTPVYTTFILICEPEDASLKREDLIHKDLHKVHINLLRVTSDRHHPQCFVEVKRKTVVAALIDPEGSFQVVCRKYRCIPNTNSAPDGDPQ